MPVEVSKGSLATELRNDEAEVFQNCSKSPNTASQMSSPLSESNALSCCKPMETPGHCEREGESGLLTRRRSGARVPARPACRLVQASLSTSTNSAPAGLRALWKLGLERAISSCPTSPVTVNWPYQAHGP